LRLRILTFTSLYPSRVNPLQGIFIHQRVVHLARRPGNSVEVIAPVPYFPSWLPLPRWRQFSEIPREEEIDGVRIHYPRYPLLPRISMPAHGMLMYLSSLSLALRLHREKTFDCIDAHFVYPDGFAAVRLGSALNLPVVVSARGTDINLYSLFRLIRPMLRWTLTHAAGAIAVSADLKNKMIALGIPEAKIQVIANGVDTERFQPLDATRLWTDQRDRIHPVRRVQYPDVFRSPVPTAHDRNAQPSGIRHRVDTPPSVDVPPNPPRDQGRSAINPNRANRHIRGSGTSRPVECSSARNHRSRNNADGR